MKIGYLGPKNSFTDQAAQSCFDIEDLIAYQTIVSCIQAVHSSAVDCAVIPIENSLEGSVNDSIDRLFHLGGLKVIGEIVLPIHQQLLVAPGTKKITKILSHPQAIAQSQQFLTDKYPDCLLEAVSSTTYAAQYVANHPDDKLAAIASKKAAKEYGLTIFSEDIQDNAFNQTRFWIIGLSNQVVPTSLQGEMKTTLFVQMPNNVPGSLHQALAAFAWRHLDLSKIESRPLKTSLGEYFFVFDLLINQNEQLLANAIDEIRLLGGIVTELGIYPVTIVKES